MPSAYSSISVPIPCQPPFSDSADSLSRCNAAGLPASLTTDVVLPGVLPDGMRTTGRGPSVPATFPLCTAGDGRLLGLAPPPLPLTFRALRWTPKLWCTCVVCLPLSRTSMWLF
eukprot:GGOE01027430.1.p4 GENE.GGOE01027430.1~~GGOE01027430.1.p4  ORF type:complete len:114 (-),score=6.55 GGOE01027430.1:148-489(-)